jgi:hypothetical protein
MNETTNAVRDVKVIEAVKTLNDVGMMNNKRYHLRPMRPLRTK